MPKIAGIDIAMLEYKIKEERLHFLLRLRQHSLGCVNENKPLLNNPNGWAEYELKEQVR